MNKINCKKRFFFVFCDSAKLILKMLLSEFMEFTLKSCDHAQTAWAIPIEKNRKTDRQKDRKIEGHKERAKGQKEIEKEGHKESEKERKEIFHINILFARQSALITQVQVHQNKVDRKR